MLAKRLLIGFALVFFLSSVGAAIFVWYQNRNARGLAIDIEVPSRVLVGIPFDVTVFVRNESRSVLRDTALSLVLPQNIVAVGSDAKKTIITRALGDLGVQSVNEETMQLLITGGENTLQELTAQVIYTPSAVGGQYKREETETFPISGVGIALDIISPAKVFSGQEFDAEITYRNESGTLLSDVRLKAVYPQAFSLKNATPKADVGNAIWNLGTLRDGGEGKITLKGVVSGPAASFFDLQMVVEANILGEWYTIQQKAAALTIEASPLSLAISLNNSENYVANTGEELSYILRYQNGTDVPLRDVILRAKLTGEMFDYATVLSNASLRAADNTLVWNAANTPALALLNPGVSGTVEFRIRVKPQYPLRRLSDKNFTLKVDAIIESSTVPQFVGAEATFTEVVLQTKVAGKTTVDAKGFFRDASSGVLNSGVYPPRVGQPTQFTIHWIVTNYGTDVNNVQLRSFLGGNVRFVKSITSTTPTSPQYNDRTQEIIWEIDRIPATKGVIDAPHEAVFQIELLPSIAQANSVPTLLQPVTLHATDAFTETLLEWNDVAITTDLPDDPTLSTNGAVVP